MWRLILDFCAGDRCPLADRVARRSLESPMAMACFRSVTTGPPFPEWSWPALNSCIASPTDFSGIGYLRLEDIERPETARTFEASRRRGLSEVASASVAIGLDS